MKAAGKYSYGGIFGISSRGLGDSSKKSVFCILSSVFCILSLGLYGCSAIQSIRRQQLSYEKLSASYNQAILKTGSSLDVLQVIRKTDSDLMPPLTETPFFSQNDTTIASTGQSKNGFQTWVTVVAFDEQSMVARRKYFYLIDEKAWIRPAGIRHLQIVPKPGLIFDSQIVLPAEELDKPYITEEARQIAILKLVAESWHKDTGSLSHDNRTLAASGMLMDHVFKTILMEFDKSPSLAKNLSDKNGVKFNHINLDKGKIRTTVEGNVVTVKCMLGVFIHLFDKQY